MRGVAPAPHNPLKRLDRNFLFAFGRHFPFFLAKTIVFAVWGSRGIIPLAGVEGTASPVRDLGATPPGKSSTSVCGIALENLWTDLPLPPPMWRKWITLCKKSAYPQGFPKPFLLDFRAISGFSTNPQPLLLLRLIKTYLYYFICEKRSCTQHEADLQQRFTVTVYQYCE